ncbi:unnamed protein product, partial [Mesorhabditis belari]|uniref:Uncharacterized protein n=1 Tax=Mesorhabditis belari TaxID=2138241 RepID=A0AAF3EAS9_9BILA
MWKREDMWINNVSSMDSRLPLLESGTLGTKGECASGLSSSHRSLTPASAQAAMAFAAADQTTIVNTMNSLRSRMAKGTEKWVGKGRNYPQSIQNLSIDCRRANSGLSVVRIAISQLEPLLGLFAVLCRYNARLQS